MNAVRVGDQPGDAKPAGRLCGWSNDSGFHSKGELLRQKLNSGPKAVHPPRLLPS